MLPPPPPPLIGQMIDPHRPAFVPRFAQVINPPVGHFAEREWAYRYAFPASIEFGGYGYACFGYGGGYGLHNFDGHFVGTAGDAFR